MASRLGLATVAEGIEYEQQMLILQTAGADQGQGFLFGRACPASEFRTAVLKARPAAQSARPRPMPARRRVE